MLLLDKFFSKKTIIVLLVLFVLIVCFFFGYRLLSNYFTEKGYTEKKDLFISSIKSADHKNAMLIWPEVYTHYNADDSFLEEFSDILFDVHSNYYMDVYKYDSESPEAYMICRDFHSFIKADSFDMVVSAVYDDYLYERIDYRTFIDAINDYYLFSLYQSPKIVELLDYAATIYDSRQSYLLGQSNQRVQKYNIALDFYKSVIPHDVIYYPLALERIDECIMLIKDQLINGN